MPGFEMSSTTPLPCPLAATPASSDILTVFALFALAALAALGGVFIAGAIRRWTQREEVVETFTIQDLRDMHASGQISDKEFAAMRSALLAQLAPGDDQAAIRVAEDESPDAETTHGEEGDQPPASED